MAVQYFRAIDGLGRIVLPAELLHHLNWEKGKMSVSIEEKDGCLIVSSVPAAGRPPASPSPVKFQDSPDGQSKIISLPVSKKWQNRFPIFIRKAVLLLVLFFGGEHPRWSDFEKPALKRPGNPYEYWKIVVRWANTVWKEFINLKSKEILSKMRIPGLE